ncbi:hypothetical protein BRD56_01810 [Thermoplasmatales archaeon SW_10_69_26]|nr:MAG: hypothetical protein BRD56_01810 [Thermoplasmatales archaeon SW_10_69_26]
METSQEALVRDGANIHADLHVDGDLVTGKKVHVRGQIQVRGSLYIGDGSVVEGGLKGHGPVVMGRAAEIGETDLDDGLAVLPAGQD